MKKALLLIQLFLTLTINYSAFSQIDKDKMETYGTPGKEFWFTIPPAYEDDSFYPNLIKIYVTSHLRTMVNLGIPGKSYYESQYTKANDVIEFYLSPSIGQPYSKNGNAPEIPEQVFTGAGIHIYSDDPIIVYCVVRYHYTSDGFLVYPAHVLGKEYIISGYTVDPMFGSQGYKLPNITGITAAFNDTKIRFTMGGNVFSKTAAGLLPGNTVEVNLQQGDVYMVSTKGDGSDLTGSKIISNKPVSAVTGNMCTNIPNGNQWCDYTAEMDIPTYTWGTDYFVPKIPKRKFSSLIRVFAKEPQTRIYRDGKMIGLLKTAGGIEGDGWIEMRMVPMDQKPRSVVISGDKPIAVTLYNTGVQEDAGLTTNSDPFVMSILPYQLFSNNITFNTPGILGSMGFDENYINLVYETDENGMIPDEYEFAQVTKGQFVWQKLKVRFPGVDELFTFDKDGKKFAQKTITLPGDGVYKIRSKTKIFAAYSFGYSDYDSYGYPTYSPLRDIEREDSIPPLTVYKMCCDGDIDGATVKDMPDDPAIRSNLSLIVFQRDSSFNNIFQYDTFIPGDTRTTNWKLNPIDPSKDARAVLTFYDRSGNDTTIIIDYVSIKLQATPISIVKSLKTGTKFDTTITLKNIEPKTAPIIQVRLLNNSPEITIKTDKTLPFKLNSTDQLQITLSIQPLSVNTIRDTIIILDSSDARISIPVTIYVGEPVILASDLTFGTKLVGKQTTQTIILTNEGSAPLAISGYDGPSTTVFKAILPSQSQLSQNPLIIYPMDNYTFEVTFSPDEARIYNDTISFTSDAKTIKNYAVLNGTGTTNSINDGTIDDFEIQSNQGNNTLVIRYNLNGITDVTLTLIDMSGKILLNLTKQGSSGINEEIIDLPDMSSGIYIIKIRTKCSEFSRKISILR